MDIVVEVGRPIQAAIDAAHQRGGGRVVLAPGVHPSATLFLASRVELHLPAGAVLQGVSDPWAYSDFRDPGFDDIAPEGSRKCLIAAAGAEDVAITGGGRIDGAGPAFYDTNVPAGQWFAKPPHPRPRMVQFYNCRNVRFEGVSFVDSPGWTFWLIGCEDVFIRGIRVLGCQQMINNDGIDIDGCRRVVVSDSVFRTGDDCLVLRAIPKGPDRQAVCEGVIVTNCVLDSRCQGIRVGCPSDDTIRNCVFSNIVFRGLGNGININNPRRYLRPGCTGYLDLRDILFTNMVIDSAEVPVWINVEEGVRLRYLGGMTFANLRLRSDCPCKLQGSPETTIEDVLFSQVRCSRPIEMTRTRRVRFNEVEVQES
ncbi:MAG: hypothetical protein GX591_15345 [Planctomycetes bacterium]|nr:hypothetical protein [Planctomycetota bacterium]